MEGLGSNLNILFQALCSAVEQEKIEKAINLTDFSYDLKVHLLD